MLDIIVTRDFVSPANNSHNISGVFFLTTPAPLVSVDATRVPFAPPQSASFPGGYTAVELAALQAGTITQQTFDTGALDPSMTKVQIGQTIKNMLDAAQTALNSSPVGGRFGKAYHDTVNGWTVPT